VKRFAGPLPEGFLYPDFLTEEEERALLDRVRAPDPATRSSLNRCGSAWPHSQA
jgi:hypothetical protein